MRVAVIGAGAFGLEHLAAYSRMPDVELVGVSDLDAGRAESAAQRFGTRAITVHEIVADAVSVVVPAHARGTLVTDLLDRGIAVLIEKPLASSAAQADALVHAARNRVAMVGHVLRFAEPYRRLAAAETGTRTGGSLSRRRSADHATRHPADDVIGLTLVHDLDAACWLSRSIPVSASAVGERGGDGRWTRCRADIRFASGATFTVEAQWVGSDSEQVDTAVVEGAAGASSIVVTADDAARVYGDALDAELRHFVDHAASGTPSSMLTMPDAALAVRLSDAVRASLDTSGAPHDLPF